MTFDFIKLSLYVLYESLSVRSFLFALNDGRWRQLYYLRGDSLVMDVF